MNLDNTTDFNEALSSATTLGIVHVATCEPRVKSGRLLAILSARLGKFSYRRFHEEILNRAYGLPFTNQKKMNWVRQRAAEKQSLND